MIFIISVSLFTILPPVYPAQQTLKSSSNELILPLIVQSLSGTLYKDLMGRLMETFSSFFIETVSSWQHPEMKSSDTIQTPQSKQ